MSFYKISSDISCNNMIKLTKKNQDENHNLFLYQMLSKNCGSGNNDGYLIPGELINVKHCHNKRSDYDLNWWDNKYNTCVGEEFNINTKSKLNNICNYINNIPNNDKLKNKFNCNNNNSCNPPDFSKANIVNCKSHITIQNKETDKLENYCPQTFKDFNYGNIKSCDLTNNNTTISYNNINCIGSDIYC